MSPVDRAGSVSEISSGHSFLCKNIDVFISEAGLARLPRSRFLRPISYAWEKQNSETGSEKFFLFCVHVK